MAGAVKSVKFVDAELGVLTRSKHKILYPEPDPVVEETSEEDDSKEQEIYNNAMSFLSSQFQYLRQHPPGGSFGKKYYIEFWNHRDDIITRFEKNQKLWNYLINRNGEKVREAIVSIVLKKYNKDRGITNKIGRAHV